MDIELKSSYISSEFHNQLRPKVYKKAIGKSGRIWIYSKGKGAGSFIHVSADLKENERGYQGFRGYGGSTLQFPLEDGTMEELIGPWHSNCDALFNDTGIDLRKKHLTFVVISKSREYSKESYSSIMKDVLYIDAEPQEGLFDRGILMAMEIAKKLNITVVCYKESLGGSSNGFVYPNQIDVYGNRKKLVDDKSTNKSNKFRASDSPRNS